MRLQVFLFDERRERRERREHDAGDRCRHAHGPKELRPFESAELDSETETEFLLKTEQERYVRFNKTAFLHLRNGFTGSLPTVGGPAQRHRASLVGRWKEKRPNMEKTRERCKISAKHVAFRCHRVSDVCLHL